MKLVFRQYLASLRERRELDVMLPDLLSELGYTIISRPSIGPRQFGVDVAALGPTADGEQKVYLFSLKQGDLTRADWDGTPQALRGSLNEILDVYIPNRIPKQHEHKKVVICLCFGGDIVEALRDNVTSFQNRHTDNRVSFEEWNGDHIAGLLSQGMLREPLVDKSLRTSFQKAIAMIDEPDISFLHFAALVRGLMEAPAGTASERATLLRQVYICLWVMFVWARDADNLESSYRASEYVILQAWQLMRNDVAARGALDVRLTFTELADLHLRIADTFFATKILPHVKTKHGLSVAVESASPVDVSLKLFDLLGRLSLRGLWVLWHNTPDDLLPQQLKSAAPNEARRLANAIGEMILNNPTLLSPIADHQSIDIGITLLFLTMMSEYADSAGDYAGHLISRFSYSFHSHSRYPTIHSEYRELIRHPKESSQAHRDSETKGSTLIPLLSIWTTSLGKAEAAELLSGFNSEHLQHCNKQFWLPGSETEALLYGGDTHHGIALNNIPITEDGAAALSILEAECSDEAASPFSQLSAISLGHWPILVMACRQYRLPLPPNLWLDLIRSHRESR